MARFHDDVDHFAQRIEQVHEDLEQPLRGDRGGQHGHPVARLGVAVDVAPVSLARDHVQPDGRADGVRQREVPVASDAEVGIELFLAEVVKGRARHASWVVTENTLEEALDKTHGTDSPPKPRRT